MWQTIKLTKQNLAIIEAAILFYFWQVLQRCSLLRWIQTAYVHKPFFCLKMRIFFYIIFCRIHKCESHVCYRSHGSITIHRLIFVVVTIGTLVKMANCLLAYMGWTFWRTKSPNLQGTVAYGRNIFVLSQQVLLRSFLIFEWIPCVKAFSFRRRMHKQAMKLWT